MLSLKTMFLRRIHSTNTAPSFSCNFATAVRTKNTVDTNKVEADTSLTTPTPFTSSIFSPSISNLVHDVDEIFEKNPFFSSSPTRAHDFMSHFWKQLDLMDDLRRKRFFSNNYLPSYDIHSDEDKVQLVIDVPGVNLSDIEVKVENDKLISITGCRKTKKTEGNETSELRFHKRFDFGEDVIDASKIVANLANGVLRVTLPKLPTAKMPPENVKKIDVLNGSDDLEC